MKSKKNLESLKSEIFVGENPSFVKSQGGLIKSTGTKSSIVCHGEQKLNKVSSDLYIGGIVYNKVDYNEIGKC